MFVYTGHSTRIRYSAARFFVYLFGLNTGLEEEKEELCNICFPVWVCVCVDVCTYVMATRLEYDILLLVCCLFVWFV